MSAKTINITYWSLTILFVLFMLMDGFGGVTRQQAGADVMNYLGYPVYALSIFGIAKILGAFAILQTKFVAIKEWAFSGFTINFIGAMMSRAYAGDGAGLVLLPLIPLGFMLVTYFFWKKFLQLPAA